VLLKLTDKAVLLFSCEKLSAALLIEAEMLHPPRKKSFFWSVVKRWIFVFLSHFLDAVEHLYVLAGLKTLVSFLIQSLPTCIHPYTALRRLEYKSPSNLYLNLLPLFFISLCLFLKFHDYSISIQPMQPLAILVLHLGGLYFFLIISLIIQAHEPAILLQGHNAIQGTLWLHIIICAMFTYKIAKC
jgi:hypothetical protein